jgi:hypothetical protein
MCLPKSREVQNRNTAILTDAIKCVIPELFDHVVQNLPAKRHGEHIVALLRRVAFDVKVSDEEPPVAWILLCSAKQDTKRIKA